MTAVAELEDASDTTSRLRLALSSGNLAIWEYDAERGTVTASPELNQLFGFPADAVPTLQEYLACYAPGEMERNARLGEEAAARGDTKLALEVKIIRTDGEARWLLVRTEPTANGKRILGVIFDITERKRTEDALAESERRLRLSQQAGGIASLELDIATGEVIGSENFWPLWGLSPRESVPIAVLENIVLPEFRNVRSTEETRHAGNAAPKVEYQIKRPDNGEIRWLARHIEFVYDEHGKPQKMFGVMHDVTLAKQAEQRQALLTHELQHRIKNILATVSAIASQTLRNGDLQSSRDSFMSRLRALSEAHNLLTDTRWTDASMRGVLDAALAPHGVGERMSIAGADWRLKPRMALSMALAVNELVTNALKYGALANPEGRVDVAWQPTHDESELIWSWRESGGPSVTPPTRRGFGSVLIERVLATDFGGMVTLDYPPAGIEMQLRVPIANLLQ